MKVCILRSIECQGRIEWHHVWIYGAHGQIDEFWAIVGMCSHHHKEVDKDPEVKKFAQIQSLLLATDEDLLKYPRKDWDQIKIELCLTK